MSQSARYRLNTRFLGRLLLFSLVLGIGTYFLHRFQEKRLINRYLTQADQAKADGDPQKEIEYLRQYIALNPNDTSARVRFGTVLAKHGKGRALETAFFTLQEAQRNDPTLGVDVRLLSAKLALRINEPQAARRELFTLLANDRDNPDYQERYAEALIRSGDYAEAETFLTDLTSRDKSRVESYATLAWLKWEKDKTSPDAANLIWREMLNYPANGVNPRAWLLAADYYRAHRMAKDYANALAQAQKLAPNDPEVLLALAEQTLNAWRAAALPGTPLKSTPQFDEAITQLQRALKAMGVLPPTNPLPEPGSVELRKLDLAMRIYNRIAQSFILADRYDDAERYARESVKQFPDFPGQQLVLLDVLVHKRQYPEAEAICAKPAVAAAAPAMVELQRGFMAAQQMKWVDAARCLERTAVEVANQPDLRHRAYLMLAMCYEQTGERDRQLGAVKASVPPNRLDPLWAPATLFLAETLAGMGQTPEAVSRYKEVLEKEPRALVPLLRLLIEERGRQSAGGPLDADIELYLGRLTAGPVVEVLRARYLQAKKQTREAREQLERALGKYPDSADLWMARYEVEVRNKEQAAAAAVVARAAAKLGDTFEVRQLKISNFTLQAAGDARFAPELEPLAAGLEKFDRDQRNQLLKMLTNAAQFINRRDLAAQWLDRLIAERGNQDMELQFLRFDIALLDGDEAKVQKVIDDIETLAADRNAPPCRLARAFTLIFKADRLKDQPGERTRLLEQATELLSGLEATRKEWSRLYLAQAKVADMLGKRDLAEEKFRQAIDRGERAPEVFARLANLYFLDKKHDAITQLMASYPEVATMLSGQSDLFVAMLISARDFTRAKEIARKSVPEDCNDPEKLYSLFRILNTCEDPIAAEVPLRKAVKLAPNNGDYWLAMVHILIKNKKKSDAKQFLESTKVRLKAEDAPLYLAQAYSLVDEPGQSRKLYEQLLKSRPDDLAVIRAAGEFYYVNREYPMAGPLMEQIIRHPGRTPFDEEYARRHLAICAAASRDHRSGMQALKVLGFSSPDAATNFTGSESLEDLDCRFKVIAVIKGRAARLATLALLREIEIRAKGLTTMQQLAFGQIQYSLGDWPDAQRRLSLAAHAADGGANAIAVYATALLRKGELDLAQPEINKLISLEPDSQRTAELAARLAMLTDRKKDAVEILKKFAAGAKGQMIIAASLLDALGLPGDAEPLYLRAMALDSNPELHMVYADFLARSGKPAEAMQEFDKVWDQVALEKSVPWLCQSMMYASQTSTPATVAKAGERIAAAAKDNINFRPYLAAFKSYTNQIPEAIALSQEVLAVNGNHVFTLNNLAFMLSLHEGRHNDAIAMIRKAMSIVGPQPDLLDTEAVIWIAAGKPLDAIEKLNEVIVDDPSATAYMHLAQAYLAANRTLEARIAIREARKLNLRLEDFHPLERGNLREVLLQLGG